MNKEVWKDVPDWEGKIKASNFGNIQVFKNSQWQNQKISTIKKGNYCNFKFFGKTFQMGIVICSAFHGKKPSDKHEADHIDENPLNNTPENLRWATRSENIGRQKTLKQKRAKRKVVQKKMNGEFICSHDSMKAAAKTLGRNYHGGVQSACEGYLNSYLGFIWEYADKEEAV